MVHCFFLFTSTKSSYKLTERTETGEKGTKAATEGFVSVCVPGRRHQIQTADTHLSLQVILEDINRLMCRCVLIGL